VALLRVPDSEFGDSISRFIQALGLQVTEVHAPAANDLGGAAEKVASAAESCQVAVMALESAVIQENFSGPISGRTAELAPESIALLAYALSTFASEQLILVKQEDDPLRLDMKDLSIHNLNNEGGAAKALRKALKSGGVVIEGRRLLTRSIHRFESPQEWWAQELDGDGSSGAVDIPSFTEFLVDSVFNRELTQTKLKDEARNQIRAREPLDLKYHYVGWKAAKIWADLTSDHNYGHQAHIKQILNAAPDFLQHIDTAGPVNYVSLGPGGGDTDAEVLKALAHVVDIASLFLVDVSIELLQIAANQIISQVLEPKLLKPPPRVRAMLSDFEDNLSKLSPILMARDIRTLFTLLGFTIGNGSEMAVLKSLSNGTRAGDYVLVDVRLHSYGELPSHFSLTEEEREDLIAPYDTKILREFAFSPVEEASDYAVRLGDPNIKVDLVPRWGHGYTTAAPSAINVYVECLGLYENPQFRESMKISAPPRRSRSAKDQAEVLRLATLTFYDLDSLVRWIESVGEFRVVWKKAFQGSGLILLERA
jgi:hypothetical protein